MTISQMLRPWILVLVLLATACTPATNDGASDDATDDATAGSIGDIELASALRPFDSCDALTTHLQRAAADLVTPYGLQGSAGFEGGIALDRAAPQTSGAESAAADSSSGEGGGTFSTTNVQEAGVDEADIVKTDGTHLYTVHNGALRIVDVRGPRPRLTATLQLDDGWPRDMLLHDGRLLLLGEAGPMLEPRPELRDAPAGEDVATLLPGMIQTRLWLVDVADPVSPVVQSTMTVDGSLLTSRLSGPTARVVVRSGPSLAGMVTPTNGPGAQARALATNRERVAQAGAAEWLPRVAVDDAAPRPLVECAAVHAPPKTPDLGMVSVLSLNLGDDTLATDKTKAVLGAADTVYASADSLYVTTSRWPQVLPVQPLPEPLGPEATVTDQPLVDQPASEPFTSDVPGPTGRSEPLSTSPPIVESAPPIVESPPPLDPSPTVTTEVHRFELDDGGSSYAASGSVPGHVLNQWALSEHDGHLRIATTEDATGDGAGSVSAVRVLVQRGSRLEQVGEVGDLGRGERIFAVRYVGDVGYVVTFRQVDPLYTLDLSDPTDPHVLGELKIPGYSAYLHPIGDDHLLGVGQDADRDGQVRGVQISMFDIADLSAPDRVGQVRLGRDTNTDVEFDHRALLYWPDRDLVVLPVQRWSNGDGGVAVLTAGTDGTLRQRGFVRQPAADQRDAVIQRSLVVDDRLVTVAPSGVMVSDLDSLAALGTVQFDRFDPSEQ
ncbi:hypothetical protein BH23ACT10_BH23ACT10_20550 [soil metagenome]